MAAIESIGPSVVDTHVHLWDVSNLKYGWLEGNPTLNRNYLTSDYDEATEGVSVEHMVFVQCDPLPEQNLAEAEWVAELAKGEPRITGIVAGAAVELGDGVVEVLDRLSDVSLVTGIRRLLHTQPDPDLCISSDFVRGVQLLESYNLSFDLCLAPSYLPNAKKLVASCSNVQFILDHHGNPDIKGGGFEPWASDIASLAEMPNVVGKVSGVITAAPEKWTVDDLRSYVEHFVESFGWDRVVFGGDWPVVTLVGPWRAWFDALCEILDGASDSECAKLFSDNAIRVYKLGA